MNTSILFCIACIAAVLIMSVYYIKRRNKFLSLLTGGVSGITALLLTEKASHFFGIEIHLNIFNLIGSFILGAPYSIVLIIMNFL